jgi:DNA-directed RNA polymerase subunit RPC12/RpoP
MSKKACKKKGFEDSKNAKYECKKCGSKVRKNDKVCKPEKLK